MNQDAIDLEDAAASYGRKPWGKTNPGGLERQTRMRRRGRRIACLVTAVATLLGSTHRLPAQPGTLSIHFLGTFDYPDSAYQLAGTGQISDNGTFVGTVVSSATGAYLGFTGSVAGTFSQPFGDPNDTDGFTFLFGIKAGGKTCGCYDSLSRSHGFFERDLRFKTYDVPVFGETDTCIFGLSNAGDFAGYYRANDANFGFANIRGNLITIAISGADVAARGINSLGEVAGDYSDDHGTTYHGFFRASDGTLTYPIDFPSATMTHPVAINDSGYIVGYWQNQFAPRGFVIQLPGTFINYRVPGASATYITGINTSGLIVGYYLDAQFVDHGFIARLRTE